jgi:hypothetical protein
MKSKQSPTSDEGTPQQRAQRILAESIAFRTSLVSEIHAEIKVMCWSGWTSYCTQKSLMKVRDGSRSMRVVDTAGFMHNPGGSRQYISSVKGSN